MELLSSKFNSLLTQYKNTYQDFVNTVNKSDNNFSYIDNSAFVGTNINTIQNSSLSNCMNSCSTTQKCSGATFDNTDNTCVLSSGNGNVVNSSNQTAIVKQALYYSYQLQQINNELMNTNNSMMSVANNNVDDFKENQEKSNTKAEILEKNYNTLEAERGQIEGIIRQYETLNSAYENGTINISSNYYNYVIYLLIALVLLFLLFKFSLTGEQRGGGNSILKSSRLLLVFLAFVVLINAYLKTYYL